MFRNISKSESWKHFYTTYLEGQWDLVSRLITPITHIVTLAIHLINLLTKSPRLSKYEAKEGLMFAGHLGSARDRSKAFQVLIPWRLYNF